jgi:hypothetical protein|nr:ATP-binding protein [uncultured Lachnoanaerobaculum sp.]
MENQIDVRNYSKLANSIGLAQYTVYKKYLSDLSLFPVVSPSQVLLDEDTENCIRLVELEKLVQKKGEDIFQKLTTVYHASMSLGCNLVVMVDVANTKAPAKIYIGVKNAGFDKQEKKNLTISFETLKNGLKSNFPGTTFKDIPSKEVLPRVMDEIFGDSAKYISSTSCIASRRDKTKTEDKTFVQGIERLIDVMQGNAYTAVFIAKPISTTEQSLIRDGYESIYSSLSAFRKSTWSYSSNESYAVMKSLSNGISESITTGTSHTQSHTRSFGANIGINSSKSSSSEYSHSVSTSKSSPTKVARAGQAMAAAGGLCKLVGPLVATAFPPLGGAIMVASKALPVVGAAMSGSTEGSSISDTIANSVGKSLGIEGGLNAGFSNTTSETISKSKSESKTETITEGNTDTKGTGKSLQIENINKPIDDILVRIDDLLNRVQECEDYGAYNCSVYFISGKQASCMLGANTFRALMIGEGSSLETGAINFWNGEKDHEPEKVKAMKEYLRRFEHPLFAMPISEVVNTEDDLVTYTAGTIVSGLELPLHMGLPLRSVYGLPVIEYAEFGKEVVKYTNEEGKPECRIGDVFNMGAISDTEVKLDINSLVMHTFITGTTGSGKSNTVYWLLNQLVKENKKFLVIEPAKGEYKKVLGQNDDVEVYGTNPLKNDSKLLRINPFSFPVEEVHILEHLDRLVEIFNVCWPMYAAMPAILKDAIERAYTSAGWDLIKSENRYSIELFPTFGDVMIQIKQVLNESDYSSDNKGDYIGSLVTRMRSLTNGINGVIFQANEISAEELFDKNVIVDISRVGSSETKALIMGILVLKLQEHRMTNKNPDSDLAHVTVLEEAHNLLRRTSTEQSSESSNLLGKSVEMLSNAIAEMRTYGEGFIIADQSPGLLDMSVIRNTNTKIIMNLPDFDDRELVGRAAGLKDEQIVEIAKLPTGVAAVYQNKWIEAVLCKIDKYDTKCKEYRLETNLNKLDTSNTTKVIEYLLSNINEIEPQVNDIEKLKKSVIGADILSSIKLELLRHISLNKKMNREKVGKFITYIVDRDNNIFERANSSDNIEEWNSRLIQEMTIQTDSMSIELLNSILECLIHFRSLENPHDVENFNRWMEYMGRNVI